MAKRIQEAIKVIKMNDRGGYTVPTNRLYPYQWNWDSVFTALGIWHFDKWRAWSEIVTLLDAQWQDGMLPHIVFRHNDPDYFPGPAIWNTNTKPPTSGHSQPPVLASIVWRFVQTGTEYDKQNALEVFSKLMAYHRWFINARDPDNRGVISIVHPWESGRDNCPDWDIGMQNIVIPNNLERYTRRDIHHVNSNQRPTQEQYDRFITIVNFGRKCNWDSQTIYSKGPFLMADPGVQFIFLRASRDLLAMAKYLEMDLAVDEITGWVEKVEVGSDFLWNDLVGGYCARDLRTGLFSNAITNASMLSFFADVGSLEQRKSMEAHCRRILDASSFGMPSWDPDHQAFESQRYWRGPVWAIMNHMVISGLEDAGLADLATRVRNDTINLINQQGMAEYFDPRNGDGLGGMDFSWTAAVYLDLNKTKVAASIVAAK